LSDTRGYHHSVTLLLNDQVLVAGGGCSGAYFKTAELFDQGVFPRPYKLFLPATSK